MIHFLIALAASPALMTLLLIGQVVGDGVENNSPATTCESPSEPFYNNISDKNLVILYVYNKSSCLCEDTLIERGRNHTFPTLFSCVSTCHTGQGSPYCVGDPVGAVNDNAPFNETDYEPPFDEPYEAFFYNVTTMQCENYTAFGTAPYGENVTNFFSLREMCQEVCSGFNITTIYGNYTTK
uniref:Putative monolaris n=1 Tax=Rhipicephalus pulchellus TaxID=72859 RepID=L7MA21_RHIPC